MIFMIKCVGNKVSAGQFVFRNIKKKNCQNMHLLHRCCDIDGSRTLVLALANKHAAKYSKISHEKKKKKNDTIAREII